MKKIKLFMTVVLLAFCLCFAFTGCGSDGNLVEGSYKCNYVQSSSSYIEYSFKVKVNHDGDYNVKVTLDLYGQDGNVADHGTKNFNLTDCKANEYYSLSDLIYTGGVKYSKITLSSVEVTLKNKADDQSGKLESSEKTSAKIGYAIGFGILGELLLGGLVAVFVLDKLGLLKKLK